MLILPEASGWKVLLKERSHPELSHSFPKLGLALGVVVVSEREVRAELKLFFQFSEQLREDFSSQLSQSLRRVELCLCQWE